MPIEMILIEDNIHAEQWGPFDSFDTVVAELNRRAVTPWDQPPNRAPCSSWKTCGREYHVHEYDAAGATQLRSVHALNVSAKQTEWLPDFAAAWANGTTTSPAPRSSIDRAAEIAPPLADFLSRHTPIGGWQAEWDGVPLEARVYLATDLPPREFVGSVRAILLRHNTVLLVRSTPPNLTVGGRCEPGESIEQTLHREVAEETGWRIRPIGVIGFIHTWHLDAQRPNWGRPAPDFVDPLFAVEAIEFDASLLGDKETACEFVPIADVAKHGIESTNQTFLRAAVLRRSGGQMSDSADHRPPGG